MKKKCTPNTRITLFSFLLFFQLMVHFSQAQNVGIGTAAPLAGFHVNHNNGVLFSGNLDSGSVLPVTGAGTRMLWYPKKAAFRAGYVEDAQWNDDSIGVYSFAFGKNTISKGTGSIAMGESTTASGLYSTAIGKETTASGINSTAIGIGTTASGPGSTAMGVNSTASGFVSTALGYITTASGFVSTALGNRAAASGENSTAMGYRTTASGNNSTALGSYASTNGQSGSFVIGDYSTGTVTNSSAANQMTMRFAGGYTFYTNTASTVGAQLIAGGNSWSTISDINRKENFLPVDGEAFLNKISKFNLSSWNYKGQNAAHYRHYGPMAQEFYAAFGKDQYGTIGNNTTINQADFDGINLIAIQALEKRTTELKQGNDNLKEEVRELKKENEELKKQIEDIKKMLQNR